MKKKILALFGLIFLTFGGYLGYKIVKKYNQNKAAVLFKQTLPNFQFYSQEMKPVFATQLIKNNPVFIFYYNAECDHCQYEAKQIYKKINLFKNTQVLMVSTNTPTETSAFAKTYKLYGAGFTWLYDKDYQFYKWFGKAVTPSVYIYNAEHKLVKEYVGEVKIEAVIKYLNIGKEG